MDRARRSRPRRPADGGRRPRTAALLVGGASRRQRGVARPPRRRARGGRAARARPGSHGPLRVDQPARPTEVRLYVTIDVETPAPARAARGPERHRRVACCVRRATSWRTRRLTARAPGGRSAKAPSARSDAAATSARQSRDNEPAFQAVRSGRGRRNVAAGESNPRSRRARDTIRIPVAVLQSPRFNRGFRRFKGRMGTQLAPAVRIAVAASTRSRISRLVVPSLPGTARALP